MHTLLRTVPGPQQKSASKSASNLKPHHFTDLVILTLGEQSKFRAGAPVPMDVVIDIVLERARLKDPQVQALGRKTLHRKIQQSFRNRRADYCDPKRAKTLQIARGLWALTPLGVEHAAALAGVRPNEDVPTEPEVPRPTPIKASVRVSAKRFYDPVLLVLALKAGFQADRPVAVDHDMLDEMVRQAHLSSEEYAVAEAAATSMSDPDVASWLRIRASQAFRAQRQDLRSRKAGFTVFYASMLWGITEAGAARAKTLYQESLDALGQPMEITVAPWLRQKVGDTRSGDTLQEMGSKYAPRIAEGYTLVEEDDGLLYLDAPGTDCPECQAYGCEACGDTGIAVVAQFRAPCSPETVLTEILPVEEECLDEGLQSKPKKKRERNITTKHLEYMIREKNLIDRMCSKLAQKLHRSNNMDEIMELVHDYLLETMEKDRFREHLEAGKSVAVSNLCNFALRRAYSKFRDAARDAHGRTMRMARTAVERKEGATEEQHSAVASVSMPSTYHPVYDLNGEDSAYSGQGGTGWLDLSDGEDWQDRMVHHMDKMRGLDMIETTLRRVKAGAPERYVGLFHKACLGMSTKDLACDEGVSPNRAATLKADLRTALKTGLRDAEVAFAVLEYVHQEPCVTGEEIAEDFQFLAETQEDAGRVCPDTGLLLLSEQRSKGGMIRISTRAFDPFVAGLVRSHFAAPDSEEGQVASDVSRVLAHLVESGWLRERRDRAFAESGALDHSYEITRKGESYVAEVRESGADVPLSARFII